MTPASDGVAPFNEKQPVHALDVATVVNMLGVLPEAGLSVSEASARLAQYGPNEITGSRETSYLHLVINQFRSPVVWLLAIAAVVALVFGHVQEAIAIFAVLLLNGLIGFVTEYKAIRSMEAIRRLGTSESRVRRSSATAMVESRLLVPGDIVLMTAGDIVAADMRIIHASGLQLNESTLTGESTVVDKSEKEVAADAVVADRSSMLFKGTAVTRGEGEAVVTATGTDSELGRITRLVAQSPEELSPLEHQLSQLSGQLIWLTLVLAALIAVIGMLSGRETFLMIESAIALAVAAIPEGLPIVAT
ncbi:MAG: HAD-IC family P-type ATPase, partial [Hyphomicrobiaceae bacterium]